jgi:SAM-dependent methyltransferase
MDLSAHALHFTLSIPAPARQKFSMQTRQGNLYDFPKYYDLVFGSDWRAEFDFLRACFDRYAKGRVTKVFEPGCGTGRLMLRLAAAGYEVAGNDLNELAVDYCNRRLQKHGHEPTAKVEDMSDFRVRKKYDAAFNMINTFRHLPDEQAAHNHLQCVAAALRTGGIYLLGLHLTPARGQPHSEEESWAARRGHLSVLSRLWSMKLDRKARNERVGMSFDVYTPSESFRLTNCVDFRTYTAAQMDDLIASVPSLAVVATHDFAYDIDKSVKITGTTEDVVYVLRKQ